MISGGEGKVIFEEFSQFSGKGGGELRTMVRNDFVVKTKAKEDFVEEKGGDSFGGDGFLSRAENYPLSKSMVDHDQERVKARGDREIHDQITGDLLEGARSRGFDRGKQWDSGVHVNFVLLALSTAFDVVADKGGQARPPELGSNKLAGFEEARVASRFMIMATCKDGMAKGVISGDVNTVFVCQNAGLHLPVSKARVKREQNVLVHGLKCLQDKGVTSRS